MKWEDFNSPLGDPPSPLDYSNTPWGNTEPLSPSSIYLPPHVVPSSPSSASSIDDTSSILESLRELGKLKIDDFAYESHEDSFSGVQRCRKDIAIFRCGCWRLDRSRMRITLENDALNITQNSKLPEFSTYDKDCGLCGLLDARERYWSKKSSEEDEIIERRKSDDYGDHVHLAMCIGKAIPPLPGPSELVDAITQQEVRKAVNPEEYARNSNGKTTNSATCTSQSMNDPGVQQDSVIERLHHIMLSDTGDVVGPDGLLDAKDDSLTEVIVRSPCGSDRGVSPGLAEEQCEPMRRNLESPVISRYDLSKRTEADWEDMSSLEERYVKLVPLFDDCRACEEETRENTPCRSETGETDAPDPDLLELVEQARVKAPCTEVLERGNAPVPDVRFHEWLRDDAPYMQLAEETNAPQHELDSLQQTSEEISRMQVTERTNAPQPDPEDFRQSSLSEKVEVSPINANSSTWEPQAETNRQTKPSLTSFVDRIHLLQLPAGAYPRKPSTETKVAGQPQLPPQRFAQRIDCLQLPDGAYLQKYSIRAIKPTQVPIGDASASNITLAYPIGSHQQQIAPMTGGQERGRPQGPPNQSSRSRNPAGAPRQQFSSEITEGADSRLEGPPTQYFRPSHAFTNPRQQSSSENCRESEQRSKGPPTQDFMPSNPTGARGQQDLSEIGEEINPQWESAPSQNIRPPGSTGVRRHQPSSKTAGKGEARLREPPRQDFRPPHPAGRPQRKFPSQDSVKRRDPPLEPPVQAFPPPRSQRGPHQKKTARDTGGQVQPLPSPQGPPTQAFPPPGSKKESRPSGNLAATGGRLVPYQREPPRQSFPTPRPQKGADVREPLGETSKQGKAPPKPQPGDHIQELGSRPRNKK